jgi:hypothetical protein
VIICLFKYPCPSYGFSLQLLCSLFVKLIMRLVIALHWHSTQQVPPLFFPEKIPQIFSPFPFSLTHILTTFTVYASLYYSLKIHTNKGSFFISFLCFWFSPCPWFCLILCFHELSCVFVWWVSLGVLLSCLIQWADIVYLFGKIEKADVMFFV